MSWDQVDQSWRETLLIVTEVGRRYGYREQSPKSDSQDLTTARIRMNLDEFDRSFKHLLDRTRRQ